MLGKTREFLLSKSSAFELLSWSAALGVAYLIQEYNSIYLNKEDFYTGVLSLVLNSVFFAVFFLTFGLCSESKKTIPINITKIPKSIFGFIIFGVTLSAFSFIDVFIKAMEWCEHYLKESPISLFFVLLFLGFLTLSLMVVIARQCEKVVAWTSKQGWSKKLYKSINFSIVASYLALFLGVSLVYLFDCNKSCAFSIIDNEMKILLTNSYDLAVEYL